MNTGKRKHTGQKIATQIKSPLGHKNMISMKVDIHQGYGTILEKVTSAFFQGGNNPFTGDLNDFDTELVDSNNNNVTNSADPFTLDDYKLVKMIPGAIKLLGTKATMNMLTDCRSSSFLIR